MILVYPVLRLHHVAHFKLEAPMEIQHDPKLVGGFNPSEKY